MKICDLADIDYLITELPPANPFLQTFAEEAVEVI